MCRRSRVKVACSFSLRAEGLNQASRSAVGKDEGMYSIAITMDLAIPVVSFDTTESSH
jgi:hypothetical protein